MLPGGAAAGRLASGVVKVVVVGDVRGRLAMAHGGPDDGPAARPDVDVAVLLLLLVGRPLSSPSEGAPE